MAFYIVAPAGVVSGGPELAHQLCASILEKGYTAKMYYVYKDCDDPIDIEAEDKFKKYNTSHVTLLEEADKCENIVIVPEGLTNWVYVFKNAKKSYLVDECG